MSHEDLLAAIVETSRRLMAANPAGQVAGEDVALEVGRDPDDVDLFNAFEEASRRGLLDCYFPGGMALPTVLGR